MKKLVLALFLVTGTFWAQSQIVFNGISPVAIQGSYDFTYTNPSTGTAWGGDISGPGYFIQDTLMIVDDGTAADSLGCGALTNDLTGKIAVIYRGSCNFSTKALNAQNAGALAVVIINNAAGPAVGMAAGVDGTSVTIPVTMISQDDGALLRAQMNLGSVVVFIGNVTGFYGDNLGIYKDYIQTARSYTTPTLTAQNDTEFTVPLGAYLFNRGSNDQTDAALSVNIDFNGSSVYAATSTPATILAGDTSFVTFPDFSQANYPVGTYTITYTTQMGATDQNTGDDTLNVDFQITNSTYSLVPVDVNEIPVATDYTRSGSTGLTAFTPCIKYENSNANRIGVEGIYFAAELDSASLDQEEFTIDIYQWNNVFDPNLTSYADNFTDLNPLQNESFYIQGDQQNTMIYYPLLESLPLENDTKYLFCLTPTNVEVNIGFNDAVDYALNNSVFVESMHPMKVVAAGTTSWYSGFTSNLVPSIGLKTADAASLGIFENNAIEGSVYPNPTTDVVVVSIDATGTAKLVVTDITGKVVMNNEITLTNGKSNVNMTSLDSGLYIFNVVLENGTSSQFSVVKK